MPSVKRSVTAQGPRIRLDSRTVHSSDATPRLLRLQMSLSHLPSFFPINDALSGGPLAFLREAGKEEG